MLVSIALYHCRALMQNLAYSQIRDVCCWVIGSSCSLCWREGSRELLSSLVSSSLNQAATWSDCVASIPSVNFTPVMTLAK